MAETIAQRKYKLIAKYSIDTSAYITEFIHQLEHEEVVKVVETLEDSGYSRFDILDIIVFGRYEIVPNALVPEQLALWYLREKDLISDELSARYIRTDKVLNAMETDGYRWVPFGSTGYILISR